MSYQVTDPPSAIAHELAFYIHRSSYLCSYKNIHIISVVVDIELESITSGSDSLILLKIRIIKSVKEKLTHVKVNHNSAGQYRYKVKVRAAGRKASEGERRRLGSVTHPLFTFYERCRKHSHVEPLPRIYYLRGSQTITTHLREREIGVLFCEKNVRTKTLRNCGEGFDTYLLTT